MNEYSQVGGYLLYGGLPCVRWSAGVKGEPGGANRATMLAMPVRALSFGAMAQAYERFRPGIPWSSST
ncbi:hypothetical protein Cme02nite_32970 [Catellatospora methionotrophica]|uniref:Uncharacterized protein n=1 Tax=Catellatospora methionotrophica TaxID=121620 RepID=A0A8J3LI80_9ACTN|nr:hypothetical protein Cme02nite_32970 [Catellatospora methionotrophica]